MFTLKCKAPLDCQSDMTIVTGMYRSLVATFGHIVSPRCSESNCLTSEVIKMISYENLQPLRKVNTTICMLLVLQIALMRKKATEFLNKVYIFIFLFTPVKSHSYATLHHSYSIKIIVMTEAKMSFSALFFLQKCSPDSSWCNVIISTCWTSTFFCQK